MANPTTTTTRAPLTGDAMIDVVTSGFKWNLTADRTVDWSLSNGIDGEVWFDQAAMVDAVAQALAAISVYANIKFNFLGFFDSPSAAAAAGSEINVAVTSDRELMEDKFTGGGYYPEADDGPYAGDVLINLNSAAPTYSYAPGAFGFELLLHELGHALGLKHPFDDDEAGRTVIKDTEYAGRDIGWFTVMSYTDEYYSNRLQWGAATPMALDVLGLVHLYGSNPATGAGDSTYDVSVTNLYQTVWDSSGLDSVNAAASDVGWYIALPWDVISTLVPTLAGLATPLADRSKIGPQTLYWLMGDIENATGSSSADRLLGNALANRFQGGGGNDFIDGYGGRDTAAYSSASTDYSWSMNPDRTWTIKDLRSGAPDGTDTLYSIEALAFSDRVVELQTPPITPLEYAFAFILRASPWSAANLPVLQSLQTLGPAAAIAAVVQRADSTTSVATLSYQFFAGKIPSEAGLDYLVAAGGPNANNLNSAYYQAFSLENRYINFAVNLGKNGEGASAFGAAYGSKTLLDTMKSAYLTVFGSTPGDAKAHALLDPRIDYFAYYGGDGPNGIGTKAAIVGWLLAEAAKADLGTMQTANIAFLTDLADGAAFSVDLVGTYKGVPYLG